MIYCGWLYKRRKKWVTEKRERKNATSKQEEKKNPHCSDLWIVGRGSARGSHLSNVDRAEGVHTATLLVIFSGSIAQNSPQFSPKIKHGPSNSSRSVRTPWGTPPLPQPKYSRTRKRIRTRYCFRTKVDFYQREKTRVTTDFKYFLGMHSRGVSFCRSMYVPL